MATNVYDYEEHIHFGDSPTVYYGWYISTSSDGTGHTFFESAKGRDAFLQVCKDRFLADFDMREVEVFAAYRLADLLDGEQYPLDAYKEIWDADEYDDWEEVLNVSNGH